MKEITRALKACLGLVGYVIAYLLVEYIFTRSISGGEIITAIVTGAITIAALWLWKSYCSRSRTSRNGDSGSHAAPTPT